MTEQNQKQYLADMLAEKAHEELLDLAHAYGINVSSNAKNKTIIKRLMKVMPVVDPEVIEGDQEDPAYLDDEGDQEEEIVTPEPEPDPTPEEMAEQLGCKNLTYVGKNDSGYYYIGPNGDGAFVLRSGGKQITRVGNKFADSFLHNLTR